MRTQNRTRFGSVDPAPTWWLGDKWHRLPPAHPLTTLCGTIVPRDAAMISSTEVMEDIATHRTTVCGTCERLITAGAPTGQKAPRRKPRLTAGQQQIRDRLDQAQRESERARQAEAADKASRPGRSTSVRTVSGGLPTLGKDR